MKEKFEVQGLFKNLGTINFVVKTEDLKRKENGKREYLNNQLTREMMKEIDEFFESYVKVPRMKIGKKQTIETLINEKSLLLSRFLRNEQKMWYPLEELKK
jgi:hypothetical protein